MSISVSHLGAVKLGNVRIAQKGKKKGDMGVKKSGAKKSCVCELRR